MCAMATYDTDGIEWWPEDLPGMEGVCWTGFGFYAFGAGLYTSPDGLTWTADLQFKGGASSFAGNGKQLVAVGPSGETDQMDCTAPPPIGQPGVSNAVIATAAHTPGLAGTQWVTDVELFNPSTDAATRRCCTTSPAAPTTPSRPGGSSPCPPARRCGSPTSSASCSA